ncbi:MAG: nitronate monooxygenase [Prevotella sp.]|nr:nitronate monooxygenase [Prevotella sp.]MEE0335898.1 nitronate monooxygenase [Prevotella sp.]
MTENRITKLFGIQYPIIQGGMVWCSGWRLAAAVSNAGGLGLLGAGSMHPETLVEHIHKLKAATNKPWGVNVPLMYPEIDRLMQILVDEQVRIVFTSAGSPKKYTAFLHEAGITVVHVVPSSKLAIKCEQAGVDAIVAEGFEAGGHNGKEETTTLSLIPAVCQAVQLPVIAAGGIACGQQVLAAMAMGAEGVQMGTVFALSAESSASDAFKQRCIAAGEGGTMLCLKALSPTRLVRNALYDRIAKAEAEGQNDAEQLRQILGTAAAKRGIFEGDIDNGELEIGQSAAYVKEVLPTAVIMQQIVQQYDEAKKRLTMM